MLAPALRVARRCLAASLHAPHASAHSLLSFSQRSLLHRMPPRFSLLASFSSTASTTAFSCTARSFASAAKRIFSSFSSSSSSSSSPLLSTFRTFFSPSFSSSLRFARHRSALTPPHCTFSPASLTSPRPCLFRPYSQHLSATLSHSSSRLFFHQAIPQHTPTSLHQLCAHALRSVRVHVPQPLARTLVFVPAASLGASVFYAQCMGVTPVSARGSAAALAAAGAAVLDEGKAAGGGVRVGRERQRERRRVSWLLLLLRALRHLVVFAPAALLALPCYLLGSTFPRMADWWWTLALRTVDRSGPALIKACQWASTRRDLFGQDVCARLAHLQEHVSSHSWSHTDEVMRDAFGDDWEQILLIDKERPIGSGCIAQVYKARLRSQAESGRHVAVKVIHPSLKEEIDADISIIGSVLHVFEAVVPSATWLNFSGSWAEFAAIMDQQLDLRREAENLLRFRRNFADHGEIFIPTPFMGLVRSNVLVEEFVECESILKAAEGTESLGRQLASMGIRMFLKMAFEDNFVHADLHSGNIKLRYQGQKPQLVILDTGIVCELTPKDRVNFIDLFHAVAMRDGKLAADLIIDRASKQECLDRVGFEQGITNIVDEFHKDPLFRNVTVGKLLSDVLSLSWKYQVRLESTYTSMIVSIAVLEGLGRQLDPSLNLLTAALPVIAKAKLQDWYQRHLRL